MINDQLTAPVEKIGQGFLAIRPFEYVILVDLHHREAPSGGAERIALASKFFFSRQQVLSRHEPFSFGNDPSFHFRFCWFLFVFLCFVFFFPSVIFPPLGGARGGPEL